MRKSVNADILHTLFGIEYLVGSADTAAWMPGIPVKVPFSSEIIDFLAEVSRELLKNREAKAYPDIVTLGFWLRRASLRQLEERYAFRDENIHLGKGVVFHIAPSNVPVNFAYSLAAGLLTGNANIVRVPSKNFSQTEFIVNAIKNALDKYQEMERYIVLIRYGREQEINDILSSMADVRVIWGGDQTIREIRKSALPPRSTEITFADRFSFAVVDSDYYMSIKDKKKTAADFYNDTYLTDQNACTSPRLVVWTGGQKKEAKEFFWKELREVAEKKYHFQPVMAVNKLNSFCMAAVRMEGVRLENREDNLITEISVPEVNPDLIEMRESCGYFFEYETDDLMELKELCEDNHIQTVGMIGDKSLLKPLLMSGIKGVDRVVEVGHTMDFDLVWDGYSLINNLTRIIYY